MKIVNEKGKLFGGINLVDLLIVIALLLAIAAVGYKVLAKPVTAAVAPEQKATVVMRVRGCMPYLADELLTVQPGDKLVAGNDFVDAQVEAVEAVPYIVTATTATGSVVASEDPIKKDVMFTVSCTGNPDAPVFKIGNQEARAGRGFTFKTKRVEIEAIVETVRFDG